MKFTESMNNWGKAGIVIFYAHTSIQALLAVVSAMNGLGGAGFLPLALQILFAILAYNSFNKGNQTNGTLFCAMLFGLIGWGIARLVNGNPSKGK